MTSKPLCKFVLGIGQHEAGKVVIVHGRAVECDHQVPISQDCPQCAIEAQDDAEVGLVVEMSL